MPPSERARFCSAAHPRSLRQAPKKPPAARLPFYSRRSANAPQTRRALDRVCKNIQRFQPISVLSSPLFFLTLSLSLYPSFQSCPTSITKHTNQPTTDACSTLPSSLEQLRPSLTLAALDRDALALHRAASSCCIASDAYPGTWFDHF